MITITVGENGPEVVRLPDGQVIHVASTTKLLFEEVELLRLTDEQVDQIAVRVAGLLADSLATSWRQSIAKPYVVIETHDGKTIRVQEGDV